MTPPPSPIQPPTPATTVVEQHPSTARRWAAPIAVGAGTVVAAVIGAGLLGSVKSDYDATNGPTGCRPCSDDAIAPLERRAYAGYAMLGLAGALVVVDVALIATTARRPRAAR